MEKKEMLPEEELEQAAGGDGWKPGASAGAVEFSPFAVPIRRYITEAKSLGSALFFRSTETARSIGSSDQLY